ncbi:MAG TPA: HAD-IA family hydrolase [bacterium]|nr:HAD-IA family hydrolase [bacterium]HPT29823.1 HAD-IA family hydrolase [bacterium]
MIENIIFDVDGVIFLSTEVGLINFTRAVNDFGLKPPPRYFLKEHWGKIMEKEIIPLSARFMNWPVFSIDKLADEFYRLCQEEIFPIPAGLPEAFKTLAGNHRLGIATNRRPERLHYHFQRLGLDISLFSHIVTPANGIQKPDPRVFNSFWQNGWHPETTLYVGDTIACDLKAARHHSPPLQFVGITSLLHDLEDFMDAGVPRRMILDNPAKLVNLLATL